MIPTCRYDNTPLSIVANPERENARFIVQEVKVGDPASIPPNAGVTKSIRELPRGFVFHVLLCPKCGYVELKNTEE